MSVAKLTMSQVLERFCQASVTQSQEHIKPVHGYVALRLVLEGGFLPEEIMPRPPLASRRRGTAWVLEYAPEAATTGEQTVFGGMKTKQIDVVVSKPGIGPVVAVSVKGTLNAYRNLANRMEEAIGDSTNLHVMYPGLVYGFLHFLRANRESDGFDRRDYALGINGEVSPMIRRYHEALSEMTGRRFVRNDFTRYEAVSLALVGRGTDGPYAVLNEFPEAGSPLRWERFFPRIYEVYDLRFPLRAERIPGVRRVMWDSGSPLFMDWGEGIGGSPGAQLGFEFRAD